MPGFVSSASVEQSALEKYQLEDNRVAFCNNRRVPALLTAATRQPRKKNGNLV
jgi:hypothetical protein